MGSYVIHITGLLLSLPLMLVLPLDGGEPFGGGSDERDVMPGSRTTVRGAFCGAVDVKLDGENLTGNGRFSHASPNRFICKYASIPYPSMFFNVCGLYRKKKKIKVNNEELHRTEREETNVCAIEIREEETIKPVDKKNVHNLFRRHHTELPLTYQFTTKVPCIDPC